MKKWFSNLNLSERKTDRQRQRLTTDRDWWHTETDNRQRLTDRQRLNKRQSQRQTDRHRERDNRGNKKRETQWNRFSLDSLVHQF